MILPVYIKTFLYNPFKLKFTQLLILCSPFKLHISKSKFNVYFYTNLEEKQPYYNHSNHIKTWG